MTKILYLDTGVGSIARQTEKLNRLAKFSNHEPLEVIAATKVKDAIELARADHFDLLIIGKHLDSKGGPVFATETARILRKNDVQIPIIVVSHKSDATERATYPDYDELNLVRCIPPSSRLYEAICQVNDKRIGVSIG